MTAMARQSHGLQSTVSVMVQVEAVPGDAAASTSYLLPPLPPQRGDKDQRAQTDSKMNPCLRYQSKDFK